MTDDLTFLINHVKAAVAAANDGKSKINRAVLGMEGMSGDRTRHLYNNVCNLGIDFNLGGATYLEVGTWKGSSFISALYKNFDTYGICVDNWSLFGGPREEFYRNVNKYLPNKKLKVLDKNCWEVNADDIGSCDESPRTIDIFMYDGPHEYADQRKAITYYHQFFSKYVIIMVDDWVCNEGEIKRGTLDGIAEIGLKVHFSQEIGLVNTGRLHCGGDTYWNGIGIFVCEKIE